MSTVIDFGIGLQIAEIASVLGGGLGVSYMLGRNTEQVKAALDLHARVAERQGKEISELKWEVKKISEAMTSIAVQEQRLNEFSRRLNTIEKAGVPFDN